MSGGEFTHLDDAGRVKMVDVSQKPVTHREARAMGRVTMNPDTAGRIRDNKMKKGNVLETARMAGIMAAKKTWDLIPMCHPLLISHVSVAFFWEGDGKTVRIETKTACAGQTGVEMEAMTAAAVAGLTIYDMCKSIDREMVISDIRLLEKSGGKSGCFIAPI